MFAAGDIKISVNQEQITLPFWEAPHTPGKGGIILLQGGKPAGGSAFSKRLAAELAASGWSVVLLNSDPQVKTPWLEQLPEVMSTLRQHSSKRLIMIHYGDEVELSLDYFFKPQSKQVNGLILLSAFQSKPLPQKEKGPGGILRFPVYEIYGQFDYEAVKQNVRQFQQQLDRKPPSKILQIPGGSHDYDYSTPLLSNYLNGWMSHLQAIERAKSPL